MAGERTQRRLAAVLVADVVGYSRLMGADETGTLAALKERRTLILDPVVKAHSGRIVKLMGDGVLIEFASAVNAVKGALDLQEKFATANEDTPEDRRIVLRIGINLGDVIGEGSDIFGDGVNIAARLEALAEPGGICVSAKVHDEVRGKIETAFEDIGEQTLKNIAAPVRAYRVRTGLSMPPSAPVSATQSKPSIAVLPFTNMSGDPEQEYFSDGITEDIITELSRFRSLAVIARNSSFHYRGKAVDIRRAGSELGARYVVEGSVRKMGGRIRITAQLLEAATGFHLWSERFDRMIEELFAVQDEVTKTIVATVTGRLEEAEMAGAAQRRPGNLTAYENLLRGIVFLRGSTASENRQARECFEQAAAHDPHYGLAHAYLALSLLVEHRYDNAPGAITDRALDLALKAVRLDPGESRCHQYLAQTCRFRGEFDQALVHFRRAMALNPNDATGLVLMGSALTAEGHAAEGSEMIRQAMLLNPFHPTWYWQELAVSLYAARRYEEALEANQHGSEQSKFWYLARMAACLAQLGRLDEARANAAEVLRRKPDFRTSAVKLRYRDPADLEHALDGLRKAGLPE